MSNQLEASSFPHLDYLDFPPTSGRNIILPVQTRKQELPFGELTWEDFEKLCYRLARLEAQVEHCQLYGERGQNQQGIDIYARKAASAQYTVYQCKRENGFTSTKIKAAVTKFLKGEWVKKTDTFVLCTKESLKDTKRTDTFEEQREMLHHKEISFVKWDSDQLSTKLKSHPKIVDDFFGRAWAEAFCGQGYIESLEITLNLESVLKCYKEWLKKTTAHFTILEFNTELSIETAWVQLHASSSKEFNKAFNADYVPDAYSQAVVMGKSGAGKSVLLQRIAHRLSGLGKQIVWVRLSQVAKYFKLGKPFAEAILIDAAENSGLEISQLKRFLANPDYLLADGLDECDGVIAQELVNWSAGHSNTRIIVTTRPDIHNAGALPGWENVSLLALTSQDIKKSTRQLLEAQFIDERQIENQLALFEQRLEVNRTASLAAQSPLLLGFLIQLSINTIELSKHRSGLYESIIELSYNQSPPNREFKVDPDLSTAFRVIEITGWILQNSPEISEFKLVEELGKKLFDELDCKPLAAPREAQKGLDFWKERRVIECQRVGHQNVVTFAHLSLQEYAAGRYAAALTCEKQREWLAQVKQESKWHEVILFTASTGAAAQIVTYLLSLNDLDNSTLTELTLAAEASAEAETLPLELFNEVIKRLSLQLESPLSDMAFEAAEALSLLTFKVPDTIGVVAQSLSTHTQLWTRLSAMKLAIECGDSYVNSETLSKLLDDIIAKPAQAPGIRPQNRKKAYKNWYFQNQIACQGFQLLFSKQSSLDIAKQIWSFISQSALSAGTHQVLTKLLSDILPEKLENKDSQEYEEWSLLACKLIPPNLTQMASESYPKNLVRDLKQKEKTKLADRVFLETVISATDYTIEDLLPEGKSRELVALGILLTSMGWWESPITDWNVLSKRQDLDAIEAVLRGMIAALALDLREITLDAQWVLNKIGCFNSYDLDGIEAALKNKDVSDNTQEYGWAWRQLIEITMNDEPRYFCKIPKVFGEPKWSRSKKGSLDTEKLICAVDHPSEIIRQNAALLLLNGAGGDEDISLVQRLLTDDQ